MRKIFYKLFSFLAIIFLANGCLKDKAYDDNLIGIKNTQNENFVEITLTNYDDNSNFYSDAFNAINTDTTVAQFIPITLTSGPTSSAVTVNFSVLDTTDAIIDSLVNQVGDVIPSSSVFQILNPNNAVTIPAGASVGYIQVKFNPTNLLGTTYILGVKLTSVSTSKYTISNLNKGYVSILVKNQWDGIYLESGTFIHPTLGYSTFSMQEPLATIGSNTVACPVTGNRAIETDITITTNTMVVNNTTVNKVTINLPAYAGNCGQFPTDTLNNPTNYYNPATKTFNLSYYYNTAAQRKIYENLVYVSPR